MMRYLIYFKPSNEISGLILRQKNILVPSSGLHSTVAYGDFDERQETSIIDDISKIEYAPFTVKTLDYADFGDEALVLTLTRPEELQELHVRCILALEKNADDKQTFDDVTLKYALRNYRPHITISRSHLGFEKTNRNLLDLEMEVSRFYLAKKDKGPWENICEFNP